jgi:hypothetical protein
LCLKVQNSSSGTGYEHVAALVNVVMDFGILKGGEFLDKKRDYSLIKEDSAS